MTRKRDTKSSASVLQRLRNACVDGQSAQNAQVLFVLERRTFGRIPVIHAGGTKSGSSLFRVGSRRLKPGHSRVQESMMALPLGSVSLHGLGSELAR